MTLSLVTPTGAITKISGSGVIAVRCHDYPGAARAGLSVVTDAASVGGDVVKEEQTTAVQTTFPALNTLWVAADDSVSIPVADLELEEDIGYDVLVSMRMTGDAPANAQANSTWAGYARNGASVRFGWGLDDSWEESPGFVARQQFQDYIIYSISRYFPSGETNLQLRGWGVVGGDVAMYFDMVYLIPADAFGGAPSYVFNDFIRNDPFPVLEMFTNGTADPNRDRNVASVPWLGQYSVLDWDFPWADNGLVDMQEGGDEPTSLNMYGFGQWDGSGSAPVDNVADPPSWLTMIVAPTYIPAYTSIDDDFSAGSVYIGPGSISDWFSPEGFRWVGTGDFLGLYQPGNHIPGWFGEAGALGP